MCYILGLHTVLSVTHVDNEITHAMAGMNIVCLHACVPECMCTCVLACVHSCVHACVPVRPHACPLVHGGVSVGQLLSNAV